MVLPSFVNGLVLSTPVDSFSWGHGMVPGVEMAWTTPKPMKRIMPTTRVTTGRSIFSVAASAWASMVAVWAALGERGYPAVMAATGLSYLAVLTVIGAVVLARVLVVGESLG